MAPPSYLPPPRPPQPRQVAVGDALQRHEPLAALLQRLRGAEARLAVLQPMMPPALRAVTRAGPWDDSGWVLLVPHSAAAAKLRQMAPSFADALAAAGLPVASLRIKVSGPA